MSTSPIFNYFVFKRIRVDNHSSLPRKIRVLTLPLSGTLKYAGGGPPPPSDSDPQVSGSGELRAVKHPSS